MSFGIEVVHDRSSKQNKKYIELHRIIICGVQQIPTFSNMADKFLGDARVQNS